MSDAPPAPIVVEIPIAVSSFMVGFKYAVRFGDRGPLYLSPAMFDLIRHAEGDELKRLLASLPVRHLPPLPNLRELAALPMTARPPEPDPFRAIDVSAFLRRRAGE